MPKSGNYSNKKSGSGKPNKYSKSKKYGKSQRTRDDIEIADDQPKYNDFSWYNANPSLTVAAASVPFPYRPGMNIPVAQVFKSDTQGDWSYGNSFSRNIPGVLGIHWLPMLGKSTDVTDPINVAGKEIYAKVRSAFSGELDADAPDFLVYLLALDSIFSYIGNLKRIYRLLDKFTVDNHTVPYGLLVAMGFTEGQINDLQANSILFNQQINELVGMTRKFRCPAVFDLFNRHYWMNDNVYTDQPSLNSQYYIFVQDAYYKWSMEKVVNGTLKAGSLNMVRPTIPDSSVGSALYQFGLELIQAFAEASSNYTISGYLMRAFEGVPNFSVDVVPVFQEFTPAYEPMVLSQITNSNAPNDVVGGLMSLKSTFDIRQDPTSNVLVQEVTTGGSVINATRLIANPTISIRKDVPTVEDVVEATRLQTVVDIMPGGEYFDFDTGSEMVWYYTLTLNAKGTFTRQIVEGHGRFSSMSSSLSWLTSMSYVSQFDWAPRFTFVISKGAAIDEDQDSTYMIFGDVDNFTQVSRDQMKQIHKICLYSEYNSFGQI